MSQLFGRTLEVRPERLVDEALGYPYHHGAAPLATVTMPGAMKTLIFIIFCIMSVAEGEVAVEVAVKALPAEFQPMEPVIRAHIVAATHAWAGHFETRPCTIEVVFSIRDWPARGAGRSLVSAPFQSEMIDGKHVSEEGAAQKIRT